MSHPVVERVRHLTAELGADPLYRASGAAMELFHSNLVAWLLRTHPAAAEPIVEALRVPPDHGYAVHRERRHLDLEVHRVSGGPFAVVENKVTALPDEAQLARYREAVRTAHPAVFPDAVFTLLSLVPPSFSLDGWEHLDYGELGTALDSAADRLDSGFDADVVRSHGRLCHRLHELAAAAGIDGREGERYFLRTKDADNLREAGLRDLVVKVRNAQLVAAVRQRTTATPAQTWEAGWSRGEPLAAYFAPEVAGHDRYLGWQLQGRQLRLAVVFTNPDITGTGAVLRQARESAVATSTAWLDPLGWLTREPRLLQPSTGSLPFNHYAPDFVYRYVKVADTATVGDLVPLLAELTEAAAAG